MYRFGVGFAVLAAVAPGCSTPPDERTIVTSVYPLAWVAREVAGAGWTVIDLTPPGAEAHDIELTLEQRAQIEDADVVVYLGDIGFQPQIEAAVNEARGDVVSVGDALIVHPPGESERGADPHIWLDPGAMRTMAELVANETSAPHSRTEAVRRELADLEAEFAKDLPLTRCQHRVAIVTHEAFNYMIGRYGFDQFGLAGVTPEAEPSAERLTEARRLIDAGEAGAVFYEEHDDARRVAETVADDAGVPALPLSTLESRPAEGDYLTVMEDNLESLREGLGCP